METAHRHKRHYSKGFRHMKLSQIKNQVFTAIALSTTEQVKAWAEAHGITADLRARDGWLTVLNAIAQQLKEQAIATAQQAAVTVRDANYEQLAQDACDKALQLNVAAVDGAIATYVTLK